MPDFPLQGNPRQVRVISGSGFERIGYGTCVSVPIDVLGGGTRMSRRRFRLLAWWASPELSEGTRYLYRRRGRLPAAWFAPRRSDFPVCLAADALLLGWVFVARTLADSVVTVVAAL